MSSLSSDGHYQRYLFEYRHKGSEWAIQIMAESPDDARERLGAISWATYKGEVAAQIAVPGGSWISRLLQKLCR